MTWRAGRRRSNPLSAQGRTPTAAQLREKGLNIRDDNPAQLDPRIGYLDRQRCASLATEDHDNQEEE